MFLCTPVAQSQTIIAEKVKFVISGSVGMPGVTMQGLPNAPMTDENGVYTAEVEYGWKGSVTPVKLGYTFEPPQKDYQKVTQNLTAENFSANRVTYTISGATLPGVKLIGLPNDPISDASGRYAATVEWGWSGSVTPTKEGYRFNPPTKLYPEVTSNLTNENYQGTEVTFVISGNVGVDGVVMEGLPGNVVTSGGGSYRATVGYGWSGKVTPTKEGHEFMPQYVDYPEVMSDQTNQNYTARVFTFQISGTANMAGVVLRGLPGDAVVTDGTGYYTALVPYGWTGTVTPEQAGYTFSPPSKTYNKVTSDYESQDFNPTIIQLTVSGNVRTSGVTIEGLPGNVVSDSAGRYSAKVEFGWAGTVTPTKEGWSFDPPSQIYSPVTSDRINQNFTAERITFTISGNVGLAGVVLEGLPGRVISDADGSYTASVGYKWGGTVTPKKPGYTFNPPSMQYSDLIMMQINQDYLASIIQHTISGQVRDETGPAADVLVLADNDGGSATTDAEGKFQLLVNHGWRGKITAQSDKYNFTPPMKSVDMVVQDVPYVNFIGRIKMLNISNAIIFAGEPFQGVKVTAEPGGYGAMTDAQGKYTIRVPYGWSGELKFEKEGFRFPEGQEIYDNVTSDIDKVAPATTRPPQDRVVDRTSSQGTQPPTRRVVPPTPPVGDTQPTTAAESEQDRLRRERDELQRRLDVLIQGDATAEPNMMDFPDELPPIEGGGQIGTREDVVPTLIDVLTQISARTDANIAVDATVKPVPVAIGFDPTGYPVPTVLTRILQPTGYTFKAMGDNTYLVYLPITNVFQGEDLRQALQDVAMMAGVTIVPDPNVTGEVWADLRNVPLETALDIMLAGSPFVVDVTQDRYLVADRSVDNPAFADISQTHSVYLNYIAPKTAVEHLTGTFARYVRADSDPNSRVVTVTAPPAMAERIITDLKRLDERPRHVLLDARVVSMKHNDLLDIGVEWGFPQISAGLFGTSFDTGDAGSWPWGVEIGYTPDQTFTNQLLMALNLLEKNSQAEIISNPQVLAQDGKVAELGVITEEYFILTPPADTNAQFFTQTEMVTIESGTKLTITPRIGDNNDITLVMATEVSDSIPSAAATELPVVTRRKARNVVTIQNGGTVALAGLTENRSMKEDRRVPGFHALPIIGGLFKNTNNESVTKELAVFVTAHLVSETGQTAYQPSPQPAMPQAFATQPQQQAAPAGSSYQDQIAASLRNQPR